MFLAPFLVPCFVEAGEWPYKATKGARLLELAIGFTALCGVQFQWWLFSLLVTAIPSETLAWYLILIIAMGGGLLGLYLLYSTFVALFFCIRTSIRLVIGV